MPPKKQADKDPDQLQLPSWNRIIVRFAFNFSSSNADQIFSKINEKQKPFFKALTRENIKQFAQEKQLYFDPATIDPKKNIKDPKAGELPTEVNSLIMAKALSMLIQENDLQGRMNKKNLLSQKLIGVKVTPQMTQQSGKQPIGKAGGQQQQAAQQVTDQVDDEEQYRKSLEQAYFLCDYPNTQEELNDFRSMNLMIDFIIQVAEAFEEKKKEYNENDLLEINKNFEGGFKQRMEQFELDNAAKTSIVQSGNYNLLSNGKESALTNKNLSSVDKEQIKMNDDIIQILKDLRKFSPLNSQFRNILIYDTSVPSDDLKAPFEKPTEKLLQDVCFLTLDFESYKTWLSMNKLVSLTPLAAKQSKVQFKIEEEGQQKLNKQSSQIQIPSQKDINQPAQKDINQPNQQEKEASVKQLDESMASINMSDVPGGLGRVPTYTENIPLYYYNKLLKNVKDEEFSVGIYLETLLDEMDYQKEKEQFIQNRKENQILTDEYMKSQSQAQPAKSAKSKQQSIHSQSQAAQEAKPAATTSIKSDVGISNRKKELLILQNKVVDDLLNPTSDYIVQNLMNLQLQKPIVEVTTNDKCMPYKLIIDEFDCISRRVVDTQLQNLESVSKKEQSLLQFIYALPGINRHLMPESAQIGYVERDASLQKLVALSSHSKDRLELMRSIVKFETMLNQQEKDRHFQFGQRKYSQFYDENCLKQQLRAILQEEPDVLTSYDEKSDKLFLCIYFKNPPGRILRKQWTAPWRCQPNFQNWLDYFKPELISAMAHDPSLHATQSSMPILQDNKVNPDSIIKIHQPNVSQQQQNSHEATSFELNQQIKSGSFNYECYEIDYEQAGRIQERIKDIYPSDNAVIHCSRYLINDRWNYRYSVIKESMQFGIYDFKPEGYTQQSNFNSQLYVKFKNGTRVIVEMRIRTEQTTISQTDDGRSSQSKQAQQDQSSDNLSESQFSQNKNDSINESQINAKKKRMTKTAFYDPYQMHFVVTLPSGLLVRFLPNGDVLQEKSAVLVSKDQNKVYHEIVSTNTDSIQSAMVEVHRVITGKGTVIKTMKDGSKIILYSNGNVGLCRKNGVWVNTNNLGNKLSRKIQYKAKEPLQISKETSIKVKTTIDAESESQITIREDKVIIVQYWDGRRLVIHADGTQIFTSKAKDQYIIEHSDYATVIIRIDQQKARMKCTIGLGSASAAQGHEDLMDRCFDGRVVTTYLPDETTVEGYLEKKELAGYNMYKKNFVYVLRAKDGSAIKLQEDGEAILVSANDREYLNSQIKRLLTTDDPNRGQADIVYFLQLFGIPEERDCGVYTADLSKGVLWTKDGEGNLFQMRSDGQVVSKIAISFNINSDYVIPETPRMQDGEYLEEENKFLPPPEKWISPRLFIIGNDNTGVELLEEDMLHYYFKNKQIDANCQKIVEDMEVVGLQRFKSIQFLTKQTYPIYKQINKIKVDLPKQVENLPMTDISQMYPDKQVYINRQIMQYDEFDDDARAQYFQDLHRLNELQQTFQNQIGQYNILEQSESDKEKEVEIQYKIIEMLKQQSTQRSEQSAQSV